MKKNLFCIILTLLLTVCLVPSALAAEDHAADAAQTLYELGLFRGTGANADGTPVFALEQTPTRNQAVIMLVRLLGREQEALNGSWELPFTDVPEGSTAYPYIGYAYANGLTNGYTATTYCGTNPIRANQYITFVLRALGYVSGEDFEVGTAWELSDNLGITDGTYNAANAANFLRADVASISADALPALLKDSEQTLAEKLMAENVFTKAQYDSAAGTADEPVPTEPDERPFTKTAFGDRWLHEYLLSLEPDLVTPYMTLTGAKAGFDSYSFEDRYLIDEIGTALKEHYTLAKVREADEPSYAAGSVRVMSTKVTAVRNPGTKPNSCYITVTFYEPDGYRTDNTYYLY